MPAHGPKALRLRHLRKGIHSQGPHAKALRDPCQETARLQGDRRPLRAASSCSYNRYLNLISLFAKISVCIEPVCIVFNYNENHLLALLLTLEVKTVYYCCKYYFLKSKTHINTAVKIFFMNCSNTNHFLISNRTIQYNMQNFNTSESQLIK